MAAKVSGFSVRPWWYCSHWRASAYVGGQSLPTSDVIYHEDMEAEESRREADKNNQLLTTDDAKCAGFQNTSLSIRLSARGKSACLAYCIIQSERQSYSHRNHRNHVIKVITHTLISA